MESALPIPARRRILLPGDERNSPVPCLAQEGAGEPATGDVVRRDRARWARLGGSVKKDDRQACGGTLLCHHGRKGRRSHDQAVDLILQDLGQELVGIQRVSAKQQQVVSVPPKLLRKTLHDNRVGLVLEIGNHPSDNAGPPGDQGACDGIRSVTELACGFEHLSANLRGQGSSERERAAHARMRNAWQLSYVDGGYRTAHPCVTADRNRTSFRNVRNRWRGFKGATIIGQ
jgi:hypothetical protein